MSTHSATAAPLRAVVVEALDADLDHGRGGVVPPPRSRVFVELGRVGKQP